MDRRKRHGVHYTPPDLAAFVVERALAALAPGPLTVLDPACGDGELLAAVRAQRPDAVLHGYDVDPEAVEMAQSRLPGARIAHEDFLAHHRPSSYSLVVTNPPYVRTQVLGDEAARLAARFGLRGRVDLTHPFVALAPSLLADGGVLALLCSNRFLSTRAGENVRTVLARDFSVREVFDLGDTRLFSAAVLPAVVVATKGQESVRARFASAYTTDREPDSADLFGALKADHDSVVAFQDRVFAVSTGTLDSAPKEPWRLSTPERQVRGQKTARHTWRTVGDVARIRVGIKTTADAVFIGSDWDALPVDRRPEDALLKPLLSHTDLRAWTAPAAPRLKVLYPYLDSTDRQVVDLADHPRAAAYLDTHRERLESRAYLIKAGRRWYEHWVPQRPALWRAPKIVFPDISPDARFALDRSGAVVNGDCYWISTSDIAGDDLAHLVLAVANSAFGVRFYDEVCGNRLYAGRRRWITQYVARLPLPDPATPAARAVVALARALADGHDRHDDLDEAVATAFGH